MKLTKLVLGMALAAVSCEGLSAMTPNSIYTYIQERYCGSTPPPTSAKGIPAIADSVIADPAHDEIAAELAARVAAFHQALAQEKAAANVTNNQVNDPVVADATPAIKQANPEKAARKEATLRRAEREAAIRKEAQERKKRILARQEKE